MVANFKNFGHEGADGRPGRSADPRPQPSAGVVPAVGETRSRPTSYADAIDGKPVPELVGGHDHQAPAQTESGKVVVVDQHYHKVATSPAQDGWVLSPHEFVISGDNTVGDRLQGLSRRISRRSPTAPATGCCWTRAVQNYDLKTGKLLTSWDALDHIPLSQSQPARSRRRASPGTPTTSTRSTSSAAEAPGVDAQHLGRLPGRHATGNIEWTLGGNHSSFKIPDPAQFQWQHDVQMQSGQRRQHLRRRTAARSAARRTANPERAVARARADAEHVSHTATLESASTSTAPSSTRRSWATRTCSRTATWRSAGAHSRSSRSTRARASCCSTLGLRPRRQLPHARPELGRQALSPAQRRHAQRQARRARFRELERRHPGQSWRVLAGPDARHLTAVASRTRTGFETAIPLKGFFKKYEVQALDSNGHVLGTSEAFLPKPPSTLPPGY